MRRVTVAGAQLGITVADEELAEAVISNLTVTSVWRAESTPEVPNDGAVTPALGFPAPGGVWTFRWTVPPRSVAGADPVDGHGEGAGMHATGSVDIDFVARGELELGVDGATVSLAAGDVVVVNGVRHRWYNPSDQTAVVFTTVIGATPQDSEVLR